jgi:microcystin-dependent protein
MATRLLGQIDFWPYGRVPKDYHICDGSLLLISENDGLFSLLGNTYGGDGRTTFGLPDMRGRLPVGIVGREPVAGRTQVALGQRGGTTELILGPEHIPPHTHTNAALVFSAGSANARDGKGRSIAGTTNDTTLFSATVQADAYLGPQSLRMDETGNDNALQIQSPVLTLVATICVAGVFPSRS